MEDLLSSMKDALKWRNTLSQTRLSSIVSQPIKVVVHVDIIVVVVFNVVVVFVMVVVDPRNLPLKSGQNRVRNS